MKKQKLIYDYPVINGRRYHAVGIYNSDVDSYMLRLVPHRFYKMKNKITIDRGRVEYRDNEGVMMLCTLLAMLPIFIVISAGFILNSLMLTTVFILVSITTIILSLRMFPKIVEKSLVDIRINSMMECGEYSVSKNDMARSLRFNDPDVLNTLQSYHGLVDDESLKMAHDIISHYSEAVALHDQRVAVAKSEDDKTRLSAAHYKAAAINSFYQDSDLPQH